jgi:hypothetical protein
VSCPEWTALAAHRLDKRGSAEPEGWNEALAHFDGGCQLCRKAALKSDPTLVFRRLAQVPAVTMTEAQERAEVDSVRQAVAAMRTASRLDKGSRRGVLARGGWKRWSAAAALTLMAVTVPSDDGQRTAQLRANLVEESQARQALQAGSAPTLGGEVDLYHLGDQEIAVVMVFDESFDESFGG